MDIKWHVVEIIVSGLDKHASEEKTSHLHAIKYTYIYDSVCDKLRLDYNYCTNDIVPNANVKQNPPRSNVIC